jgi:hypothetical protein
MAAFYINTYRPLVDSRAGRHASQQYGLPPFVDGSIRREPDLEHEYPAITCLCRAGKFAPRLEVDDIVAYMLRKGRYGQKSAQRRMTAVLRVIEIFPSHTDGASWYRSRGMVLPSNCWVRGNLAKPFEESHRRQKTSKSKDPIQIHHEWDLGYRVRAKTFGSFVVCESLYRNLSWSALEVTDDALVTAFGKVPATLNPGKWTLNHARKLLSQLGIDALPSAQ